MQPLETGLKTSKLRRQDLHRRHVMNLNRRLLNLQKGFTLIELMVVVVIMSVVVAVGMISMGGNEQATVRAQERSAKALLSYVRDKAAIKQQLFLVAPEETGLTTYFLTAGKWQVDPSIDPLVWDESLTITWDIDNTTFAQQQNLPKEGWVFWPSGDVLAGSIEMTAVQNKQASGLNKVSSYSFRWDGLLQFSYLDADER